MTSPLLSVIVPVFNAEAYLPECVESIRNQSLRDMEIILVNDGSTDNSGIICDDVAKSDKRVSVIHQSNLGPGAARNAAVRKATGHWLLFVDADDYLHQEYAETLYSAAKELNAECVLCGSVKMQDGNMIKCPICNTLKAVHADECIHSFILEKAELHIPFAVTTRIISGDIFKKGKIEFPENQVYEDLDVSYQILRLCGKIGMTPDCLYYRRILNTSITHSNNLNNLLDKKKAQETLFIQLRKDYPSWEYDIRRGEEKRRIGMIKDLCKLCYSDMSQSLKQEIISIYTETRDHKRDLHTIEDADNISDLESIVLPSIMDGEQ